MKLTREQAKAFTWGGVDPALGLTIEADRQVDTSRWVSIHQLVLKDRDGKLWAATYKQGLTEYQDCQPFEDDTEVEFYEVDKVPVTTYEYRRRPEGGVREPLGSGPDSPPAGVDGIPGPGGKPITAAPDPDGPRHLEMVMKIGRLTPDEFMAGLDEWIAIGPEGTTFTEFLCGNLGEIRANPP